ncbi:MAG: class I SAM-dependent methyltransferase [Pyrinomonadaceae bacterium]
MSNTKTGQVNKSAAEVYEEFFVPAIFRDWAAKVADEAGIEDGQAVLDVACGTGVLAREAFSRVGPKGSVTGIDINDGMLAVAEKKEPGINWQKAPAESLPFENESFDRVVSQFGLMFFVDRVASVGEMYRVLKPGGRLAVAVWDSLEKVRAYAEVVKMLDRLFGPEAGDSLRSPYSLGDPDALRDLFAKAEVPIEDISNPPGAAKFPSIKSWVSTDVKGWTLADLIDDEKLELLLREAEKVLQPFVSEDGSVLFEHPAYIVTAVK